MEYRKAVFIVVYRKEKDKLLYLLLKRKLHWKGWEFPKGGLENKENEKKAVLRELKEETGQISINILKHKHKGSYRYKKKLKDRKYKGQTYNLYSAEIKSKKVKIDRKEHSAYIWLDFNKAVKRLRWSNQKKCLRIINREISKQ